MTSYICVICEFSFQSNREFTVDCYVHGLQFEVQDKRANLQDMLVIFS